ncbi:hypothetical protein FF125_20610 [Aureibaculum algae]|uniref:SecDF P1 head subdomain domain-containing protein n=1 Tax=Aureibaculum algae TaxID=2584122 RepID=A0A5B7TV70_9FLAO|nr:hypothetical protein [Aureibaculum algae]QCX40725.1 hypothetical protein FF125_20610 [Aureibaculum algae]
MRSKIIILNVIFFLLCSNSYAQDNSNGSKVVRFNGIYQTSTLGKEFILKSDSTKTFKVDTSGFVGIHRFKKVKNSFDISGRPSLTIELDGTGEDQFLVLTENNIGKPLAIIINNVLYMAPIVHGAIPHGILEISGFNSVEELEKLKRLIDVIKIRTAKRELD